MTLIPTVRKQTDATFRQTPPPPPPNSSTPYTCCNRSWEEWGAGGGGVLWQTPHSGRADKSATVYAGERRCWRRPTWGTLPVRVCAHFHVFAPMIEPVIMLVVRPAKVLTPPLITWINQVIQCHWLINQSRGADAPPSPVLKAGYICINATCAAQVNDLPAISYLVLKRGVWSLPSPPIKHMRSSLAVICLFLFGPTVPLQPLALLLPLLRCFCSLWLRTEEPQCSLWLCSCSVQPLVSQSLLKVSWWVDVVCGGGMSEANGEIIQEGVKLISCPVVLE